MVHVGDEDELPWDPLWAYVLGDDEEQKRRSRGFAWKSAAADDEGFLSYIHDMLPANDSRDESWLGESPSASLREESRFIGPIHITREETKKGFWPRNQRGSRSIDDESWEWRLDSGSNIEERTIPRSRSRRASADSEEKWEWELDPALTSLFDKDPSAYTSQQTSSRKVSIKSNKVPSTRDAPTKRAPTPKMNGAPTKNENRKISRSMFGRRPAARESWNWHMSPSNSGGNNETKKRGGPRRFSWTKEHNGAWDWQLGSSIAGSQEAKKETRRVRFPRNVKEEKKTQWVAASVATGVAAGVATGAVVEQLQRSQSSLFDWVGINPSNSVDTAEKPAVPSEKIPTDGAESKDTPVVSGGKKSLTTKEKKHDKKENSVSTPNSSSFLFGDLFSNWGESSSSDDSSLNSSAQDSSVASLEEASLISDDDTKSASTLQSDVPSSDFVKEKERHESKRSVKELHLAHEQGRQESFSTNLLPAIKEDGSMDENHLYADDRSGSDSEKVDRLFGDYENAGKTDKQRRFDNFKAILEELEDEERTADESVSVNKQKCCKPHSLLEGGDGSQKVKCDKEADLKDDAHAKPEDFAPALPRESNQKILVALDQPQSQGKGISRSVKSLFQDQLKWSAQSGVPFHEMSQQDQSQLFSKVRSVADEKKNVSSSVLVKPHQQGRSCPAHLQVSLEGNGPISLFEYEYETGVHMYASYERFGADGFKVKSAPTPSPVRCQSKQSLNEILVQVEASTVSRTDCCVRQGNWWGYPEVPLPYTPGVDVVGRLYRVDTEATRRFGLSVGDRVLSLVKWGGNARYLSVDPSKVVIVPESVDPAAAACLAETYLAAFQILHRGQSTKIRYGVNSLKGKTLFILGHAISTMGRAIAQLASDAGALQVCAMGKLKHFSQLTALGISPLNKDSLDWWEALAGKVDIIVSCEEEVVALHYQLLKGNGQVVVVKNSRKDDDADINGRRTSLVCRRNKKPQQSKMIVYDVYEEWDNNIEVCKLDLLHLVQRLEQNKIEPFVLDRLALGKVARAQELIESKRLAGFIVCEPWLIAKSRAIRL